ACPRKSATSRGPSLSIQPRRLRGLHTAPHARQSPSRGSQYLAIQRTSCFRAIKKWALAHWSAATIALTLLIIGLPEVDGKRAGRSRRGEEGSKWDAATTRP